MEEEIGVEKRSQVLQEQWEWVAEDCMISHSAFLPHSLSKKAIYEEWAIQPWETRSDNLPPQRAQSKVVFVLIDILSLIFHAVEWLKALTVSVVLAQLWKI